MSLLAVLEIIGKGIEELQRENLTLGSELDGQRTTANMWREEYRKANAERDELKAKLQATQDYADSLEQEIEDASNKENGTLRALTFGKPDEVIYAGECESVSMEEKNKESGC